MAGAAGGGAAGAGSTGRWLRVRHLRSHTDRRALEIAASNTDPVSLLIAILSISSLAVPGRPRHARDFMVCTVNSELVGAYERHVSSR